MRWLFTAKGVLTYSPSIVAASIKALEESATPDMQVTFAAGSFKGGQTGKLGETPGSAPAPGRCGHCRAAMLKPSQTGGDAPAINPRYLFEESDRRAIIGGWAKFAADDQRRGGAETGA